MRGGSDGTSEGRGVIALAATAWALGVLVRAAELPRWGNRDSLWPTDTPVAATHDAYAWLLAAGGLGAQRETGFGRLLRALGDIGCSDAALLLLVPVLLSPVAGALVTLLHARCAGRDGALLAGVVTNIPAAYLLRTRAGMLDTDGLALTLPLLVAVVVSAWARGIPQGPACSASRLLAGGLLVGSLLRLTEWTYPPGLLPCIGLLLVAPLIAATGAERAALAAMACVGFASWSPPSWIVAAACAGAIAALLSAWLRTATNHAPLLIVLAASVAVSPATRAIGSLTHHLPRFAGALAVAEPDGRSFPSLHRFVAEAQPAQAWLALGLGLVPVLTCLVGAAGFAGALVRHPHVRLLAPLAALGAGGTMLGTRFLMYAGPAIGVGLGWLVSRAPVHRRALERVACASACLVAAALLLRRPLTPVVSHEEADAMRALAFHSDEDAVVWCSWEIGYAVQYLSGRRVFTDGGRASGPWLVPWAKALGTADADAASARIRAVAHEEQTFDLRDELSSLRSPMSIAAASCFDLDGACADRSPRREQVVLVGVKQAVSSSWLCPYLEWNEDEPASCWIRFAQGGSDALASERIVAGDAPIRVREIIDVTERPPVVRRVSHAGSVVVRHHGGWVAFSEALGESLLVQLLAREPGAFEPRFTCIVDSGAVMRAFRVEGPQRIRLAMSPCVPAASWDGLTP